MVSTTKSVVPFFLLDPRETNGKARPKILLGTTEARYEEQPKLLGVYFGQQHNFRYHATAQRGVIQQRSNVYRQCTGGGD